MDILGFLAFEMVRTLCMAGLQLRNQANSITTADLEKERIEAERMFKEREEAERIENEEKERLAKEMEEQQRQEEAEQRLKANAEQKDSLASSEKAEGVVDAETDKGENDSNSTIKKEDDIKMASPGKSGPSKDNTSAVKPITEPTKIPPPIQASPKKPTKQTAAQKLTGIAALLPPPTASQAVPLLPAHILGAYSTIQREQARTKNGGLRDWRGGAPRSRAKLL
jgi:hypothetical protein